MSETTFLNVGRPGRLANYMGLKLDDGIPVVYGRDYTYVEIPLRKLALDLKSGEAVSKVLRNQSVLLSPACELRPRGNYKVVIKVNPKLAHLAHVPLMYMLDGMTDDPSEFVATFRKDFDLETDSTELGWGVRVYLIG